MSLTAIGKIGVQVRSQRFCSAATRNQIVFESVRRKRLALRRGVTWERVTGARVRAEDFGATKRFCLRFLKGEVDSKKAIRRNSVMVLHKAAVHLALAGKFLRWDRVPQWRNGNRPALPEYLTKRLLPELTPPSASKQVRELHRCEVVTAARCSRSLLFREKS